MTEVEVCWIGEDARRALEAASEARVCGATSRGIFLSLSSNRIVYLTPEEYRGPLTLNIQDPVSSWKAIRTNQPVRITTEGIFIGEPPLEFLTDRAATWSAPLLEQTRRSQIDRAHLVDEVARLLLERMAQAGRPVHPLTLCFLALWGIPDSLMKNSADSQIIQYRDDLVRALDRGNETQIAAGLKPLLGLGSGLTPSGDDLTAGVLLALNRWGSRTHTMLNVEALNRLLVQLGYVKTTTLSANLIECAARGQADERLVRALDGIETGELSALECAEMLGSWGNTSGLDALVGMGLACR